MNTQIVDIIEIFGGELMRTSVKKHTLLGMDIYFIGDGKVVITTPKNVR